MPPAPPVSFGALLPIGRRRELAGLDGAAAKWACTVDTALEAEALGYDSVWVYDHLHNVPEPANEAVFESWTTLAAISQRTARVRLGHLAGNNLLRSPALVARMAATLDVMSGGRLEWGIGAGWEEREARAHGFEFPAPAERIARLGEAVEVVRALWTKPEVSIEGRHYRLESAQCDPKPLQRPHPPIWIAGRGERLMLRLVARAADCSNFGGSPEDWGRRCEVLRRHCAELGRDYDEITRTWSHDAFLRASEAEIAEAGSRGLWGESPARWREENLVGTPEQVAEKVARYQALGCRAFILWCADYPSHQTLRLFAERVIPAFR
jgi:F420-dependent oxidoreductase-like protein